MYSFYGGKEGRTYNLVTHYDSIHDMVLAFNLGGSNTDANYNEYVIIDTIINKNDRHNLENGIIYRRGLNYSQRWDPNEIIGTNDNWTITVDDLVDVELVGYNGVWYNDDGTPKTGEQIPDADVALTLVTSVPRFRHYEYCLTTDGGSVVAEVHALEKIQDEETGSYLFDTVWATYVENPGGGAVYVGQIVGPQGSSPLLQLTDWDTFESEYLHGENAEAVKGEILATRRPGYDSSGEYHDDIKYGYCNVRDAQGNVVGAVLSADIPYTLFKWNMESASAYGPVIKGLTPIEEIESEPVYPYETVDDLPTEVEANVYYYVHGEDAYYIWDETRKIPTIIETVAAYTDLPGVEDVSTDILYYVTNNEKYYRGNIVWVEDEEIEPGEEEEGTLIVEYIEVPFTNYISQPGYVLTELWAVDTSDPNGANWKYTNLLREYAESQGHNFYKNYNVQIPKGIHGQDFIKFHNIPISSDAQIHDELPGVEDYDLIYTYKNYEDPETRESGTAYNIKIGTLKVIKNTEFITELDGQPKSYIQINYWTKDLNDEYEYDQIPLKRLTGMNLAGDGILTVNYVEGDGALQPVRINADAIKWIDNIVFNAAKQIQVTYNTDDVALVSTDQIRTVANIGIENDKKLSGNKQFYYQYNVEDLEGFDPDYPNNLGHHITISAPLNEVVAIQLVGDNLAVLYSDAIYRRSLVENSKPYYLLAAPTVEESGWTPDIPDVIENNVNLYYWANLGPSLSGEHIFGSFDSLADLELAYPNGFGTDLPSHGREGWIATVTTTSGGITTTALYAFDYHGSNGWYEISSVVSNEIDAETIMILSESVPNGIYPKDNEGTLKTKGYWFVVEDIDIASDL